MTLLSFLNAEGILPITCERTVRRTSIIPWSVRSMTWTFTDLLICKYYLIFGQIE
jgi:hypothetical protein